ncbi:hypothetical protein LZ30DRAFT_413327 [Colletotrichum cereale]|nr:hypothetical protein LZ30DRAFT_413327 [Colletotrichum cereale]
MLGESRPMRENPRPTAMYWTTGLHDEGGTCIMPWELGQPVKSLLSLSLSLSISSFLLNHFHRPKKLLDICRLQPIVEERGEVARGPPKKEKRWKRVASALRRRALLKRERRPPSLKQHRKDRHEANKHSPSVVWRLARRPSRSHWEEEANHGTRSVRPYHGTSNHECLTAND